MLKQNISADHMIAFKNRNQVVKAILSTVIGEIQTVEKNLGIQDLPNDQVEKILTKFCKSLQETIDLTGDPESIEQLKVLKNYLPTSMSEDEVRKVILDLKVSSTTPLTIGTVMSAFAGKQVDRKLVATLFAQLKD